MQISDLGDNNYKVTLHGRLDTPGVDRIETRFVASLVPKGHSAIVDLSGVDFVASMGIRMLLSAARSLHQKKARLVLMAPQPAVREVFETVSLGDIVPICDDEPAAMAALAA
jgi:anti-anti-sigma factor